MVVLALLIFPQVRWAWGCPLAWGQQLQAVLSGSERQVYVMLGDGEIQEGSVWEAAMAATHHELGNLNVDS